MNFVASDKLLCFTVTLNIHKMCYNAHIQSKPEPTSFLFLPQLLSPLSGSSFHISFHSSKILFHKLQIHTTPPISSHSSFFFVDCCEGVCVVVVVVVVVALQGWRVSDNLLLFPGGLSPRGVSTGG